MGNYANIKRKYNELKIELNEINLKLQELSLSNLEKKATEKIDDIKNSVETFLEQIKVILKKVERLSHGTFNSEYVSSGNLFFDENNILEILEDQKKNVLLILRAISSNGVSAQYISKLKSTLGNLYYIKDNSTKLHKKYLDKLVKDSKTLTFELKQRKNSIEEELESIKGNIYSYKENLQNDIKRFKFENMTLNDKYDNRVVLPIALKEDEIDTVVQFWDPFKDLVLLINNLDNSLETEKNSIKLIKSAIMQFLYAYPNLDKKILYCNKTTNNEMNKLLGLIAQDGKSEKNKGLGNRVFFRGVSEIDTNDFKREVAKLIRYLSDELKARSLLFENEQVRNIYEYNSIEDINVKPPILVVMNNYPLGYEECKDLDFLLTEGSQYGIFFIIVKKDIEIDRYRHDDENDIDVERYACLKVGINSQGLFIDGENYQIADINNVANLLKPLIEIKEKNKKKNILYEKIGFGEITRSTKDNETTLSIPVGKEENEIFNIEFSSGSNSPLAYLLIGAPGTGKSSLIDSLIVNGAMTYSPDDLIFYLLDFKDGMLSKPYEGENAIPHIRLIAAENKEEDAEILLKNLIAEKERRNSIFTDNHVQNIAEYNKIAKEKMPRIIIAIDECYPIFSNSELSSDTALLIRQGRSTGIHFFLANQSLNKMSNILKFIDGRFCYYVADKSEAREMIGEYAELVSSEIPKGSHCAYASMDSGKSCVMIRPAFHGGSKNHKEYNRKIREKWLPQGYTNNLVVVGEKSELFIDEVCKNSNILKSNNLNLIPYGEDYFNHNISTFELDEENNHSLFIIGEDENISSNIFTSIMIGALRKKAQIKLIDESKERSLHKIFGSHPLVESSLKDGYLKLLNDFNEEFKKRIGNRRIKQEPYFLIINGLNFIDDFENDKQYSSSSTSNANFELPKTSGRIDLKNWHSSMKNSEADEKSSVIFGRKTFFNIIEKIKDTNNIFIIFSAKTSDIFKSFDEKKKIKEFDYKLVQNNPNSSVSDILNDSFKRKNLNGLNENLILVSTPKQYSRVRLFKYDLNNKSHQKLIVDAVKGD